MSDQEQTDCPLLFISETNYDGERTQQLPGKLYISKKNETIH